MSNISSEFKIGLLLRLKKSSPDKFQILLKNEKDKKVVKYFNSESIKVGNEKIKIKRVTEYKLPELDNSEFILS